MSRFFSLVAAHDHSRINGCSSSGYYLKMHFVFEYLNKHEGEIAVERLCRQRRIFLDIARTDLASGSGDEIGDPILRFYTFIEMIVAREDDIDSMLNKQGVKGLAHLFVGTMAAT